MRSALSLQIVPLTIFLTLSVAINVSHALSPYTLAFRTKVSLNPTVSASGRTGNNPRNSLCNSFRRDDGDELERRIEQNAYRRAVNRGGAGAGTGEIAAGAILGGLLLGPFGALFGASLGSNIGAKNAIDRARKEEMERMGITAEMLEGARDIGLALERSMEGLQAIRTSLETQQQFARRLDADADQLYAKAKSALESGNEDASRLYLLDRTKVMDKLKEVLKRCAEEKRRYEQMESNVAALEQRASEVNALLNRAIGARSMQDAGSLGLGLTPEDPLLRKFRDAGLD